MGHKATDNKTFCFKETATTEIYTLSLHDALPISHRKFVEKQSLNFPLLSDTEHKTIEKYGLRVEKKLYGRAYWGVQRATLLLDSIGKVAAVWPKVKPKGHAAEVLEAAKAL